MLKLVRDPVSIRWAALFVLIAAGFAWIDHDVQRVLKVSIAARAAAKEAASNADEAKSAADDATTAAQSAEASADDRKSAAELNAR